MSRICRAVLIGLTLACLSASAEASTTTVVKVGAAAPWKNTGITLHAGDPVTISASGTWNWSNDGGDPSFSPEGDPLDDYNAFDLFSPFDFFSQGRLIAYIGDLPEQKHGGDPSFFPQTSGYISIGDGQTFIAPYDGTLWLGFNDGASTNGTGDNTGFATANIVVGSATPVGPTISITAPQSVYLQGTHVTASYSCSDPVTVGCSGDQTNGGDMVMNDLGPHAFTVIANDSNANTASQRVGYVVVDTNTAGVMPVGGTFLPTFLGSKSLIQNFQLVNPQASAMTITTITTEGDFHVSGTTCGVSLAAHHACNIHVYFQPSVTGSERGAIDVNASLTVPSTPLWGVGTQVKAMPVALSFPDQAVSTTSTPMTVTLQNFQPTEIIVNQIVVTGDFALDPSTTCPVTTGKLRKIRQCSIAVTFSPTATGARSGTLTVHATANVDPVTIPLGGNGTP